MHWPVKTNTKLIQKPFILGYTNVHIYLWLRRSGYTTIMVTMSLKDKYILPSSFWISNTAMFL